MAQTHSRPTRTLGISLAILLTILFFTIIPLVQVTFTLYIRERTRATGILVGGSVDPIGGALGIAAITNTDLLLRAIPAILFLGIAGLAWRGTPTQIRFVFIGSVVGLLLWNILLTYLRLRADAEVMGMASDGFLDGLRNTYFVFSGLVVLYTLWYMNRAPARAFYRGYFLDSNKAEQQ